MGKSKQILKELQHIRETGVKQQVTLERLTTTVEVHERRSTALEASMKPVQKHVAAVEGVLKALGASGLLTAALSALWKVLH